MFRIECTDYNSHEKVQKEEAPYDYEHNEENDPDWTHIGTCNIVNFGCCGTLGHEG